MPGTDTENKNWQPTAIKGDDAADSLIHIDTPSRHRSMFDVYRSYGWPDPDEPGAYSTPLDTWKQSQVTHTDTTPPRGVPVFWGADTGLVGISAGHGLAVVTTIDPERSIVVGILWVAEHTGLPYLGWSEDFMGHHIMWSGRMLGELR